MYPSSQVLVPASHEKKWQYSLAEHIPAHSQLDLKSRMDAFTNRLTLILGLSPSHLIPEVFASIVVKLFSYIRAFVYVDDDISVAAFAKRHNNYKLRIQ